MRTAFVAKRLVAVAEVLVLFVELSDWIVDEESAIRLVAVSVVMLAWFADNWVVMFTLVEVAFVVVAFVAFKYWIVEEESAMSPPPNVCTEFQVLVVVVAGKRPRTPNRARASW